VIADRDRSDAIVTPVRYRPLARGRRRAVAASLAGPLLILASVLVILHPIAFGGMLSTQHPDLLNFWLPEWCFLGRSLAAGHIPAWNPHVMGGLPFAADPQSGWMSIPVMTLFSGLGCGTAMRWFLVLQPTMAGLGIFWFLRSEGISRPAATVGGLVLALPLAASGLLLNVPFAATFAWTALVLAAASRVFHAATWSARLAWIALTALAWGQLAASHFSQGLIIGTGLLLAYLVARLVSAHRTEGWGPAGAGCGLLVLALPLVNLAYLLPRLAYLPGTTLAHGYSDLSRLSAQLGSSPGPPLTGSSGLQPSFLFRLAASPGFYLGALALGAVGAGLWSRRLRPVATAMVVVVVASYVMGLRPVVRGVPLSFGSSFLGGIYLHGPDRWIFASFVALPILAGLGVEAWREHHSARARLLMIGPGALVWGLLPSLLGLPRGGWLLPLAGAVAAIVLLAVVVVRPTLVLLLPLLVAGELVANGLLAQDARAPVAAAGGSSDAVVGYFPLLRPRVPAGDDLRLDAAVRAIATGSSGRYLAIAPAFWSPLGYRPPPPPAGWGLIGIQRSMLVGLEEAQGYNPVQSLRYWSFVRAIDPKPIRYNAAGFITAEPLTLDLLQVAYLVQPATDPVAVPDVVPVARERRWEVYRLRDPAPRASVVTSRSVVSSAREALARILAPGFDPRREVVLEARAGLTGLAELPGPSAGSDGSATYVQEGPQAARVEVESATPAIVLVRNTFDSHWSATVDGRSAPVLVADSFLQAVPVPAGRHTIRLSYDDPTIGYGLLGSAVSIALLLGIAAWLLAGERRERSRSTVEPTPANVTTA
jgi:hypothetical protein